VLPTTYHLVHVLLIDLETIGFGFGVALGHQFLTQGL
jgi:hypothetical protein